MPARCRVGVLFTLAAAPAKEARTQLKGHEGCCASSPDRAPDNADTSVPPARVPRATPCGTSDCKTSERGRPRNAKNPRSSRAGHNRNFFRKGSCDGPRALLPPAPRRPQGRLRLRVLGTVRGIAEPGRRGMLVPRNYADNVSPPARRTSDERPRRRHRRNTAQAGDPAETAVHSPSASNAATADGNADPKGLDPQPEESHLEGGPREVLLPEGHVSKRS